MEKELPVELLIGVSKEDTRRAEIDDLRLIGSGLGVPSKIPVALQGKAENLRELLNPFKGPSLDLSPALAIDQMDVPSEERPIDQGPVELR